MADSILVHHPDDDVGVAIMDLASGTEAGAVTLEGSLVRRVVVVAVGLGHKLAMRDLPEGKPVEGIQHRARGRPQDRRGRGAGGDGVRPARRRGRARADRDARVDGQRQVRRVRHHAGLAANPTGGRVLDRMLDAAATAHFGETSEITGMLRLELTLDQAADRLMDTAVHTVNGRLTAAEALRHDEFVLTRLYRSA